MLAGLASAAAAVLVAGPNPVSARQAESDHEGALEVRVEDSAAGSSIEHFLHARGRRFRLRSQEPLPAYLTGTQVRVRGRQSGDVLDLNHQSDMTTLAAALPNVYGAQRTIVILVNFEDRATVRLGDGRVLSFAGLFLGPKSHVAGPFARELGLEMEEGMMGPIIKTDAMKQTSVPGVFAWPRCNAASIPSGVVGSVLT